MPDQGGAGGVQLLVIGLDAADEQMLDPLEAAGRLPHLAALRARGASGPLRSHMPMLSPILWNTIATGVSPSRHGVLDFVEPDGSGGLRPIGSGARRRAAVWDILGGSGWKVGVVGWLATWPATRVNGWMVSDRVSVHPFEPVEAEPAPGTWGKTWPPEFIEEIAPLVVAPGTVSPSDRQRIFGIPPLPQAGPLPQPGAEWAGKDERALQVVAAVTQTHRDIGVAIARRHSPRFLAIYFDGLDRLSHIFADVAETPLAGSDPRRAARYGRVIENYLAVLDESVGALVESAGPGAVVVIVSDHGWKTGHLRPRTDPRREGPFAPEWHRDEGIIILAGPGVRAGVRLQGADLYDVAPTLLALAGRGATPEMEGKVLSAAFEPGSVAALAHPADTRVWPAPEPGAAGARDPASGEEARTALEALQGLGYIGGAAGAGAVPPAAGASGLAAAAAADRRDANLAGVYLDEGRADQAADLLEGFIRIHPHDYDALFNLGVARRRLNDLPAARRAYTAAAAVRPGAAEVLVALGEIAANEGRAGEAAQLAARALKAEPDNAPAWNLQGVVEIQAGRVERALAAFRKASALDPSSVSPRINISRALAATGRRDEAIATLEAALRDMPGDKNLLRRLEEIRASGPGSTSRP